MKTFISLLSLILFLMPAVATARNNSAIHRTDIKVGQFSKLKVIDNVNVIYRCLEDSTGYVVYHGTDDFDDAFIINNNGGTLSIQVTTEDVGKPNLPTLVVYSDYLSSVESSSLFSVKVYDPAPCPKFKASLQGNGSLDIYGVNATKTECKLLTGNGKISISGKTENASFRMIGVGSIQASDLTSDSVNCRILGSGDIYCNPIDKLLVKGIGSTKIYYAGNPRIRKSGGGRLIPLTD